MQLFVKLSGGMLVVCWVTIFKMKDKDFNCEKKISIQDFKLSFTGIMAASSKLKHSSTLYASAIETKVGPMLAIADEKQLYLLEFMDWWKLKREIGQLREKTNSVIILKETKPLISIKNEIKKYFEGKLKHFKTPLCLVGTPFQINVWEEIAKIPYGQTRSYADIAVLVGKPSAYRAVANAAGINQFAVVIPCHRVISHNGGIGGYGTSIDRKRWLIHHEQNIKTAQ
ncbi:MAG: hypothetical protein BGO43_07730 [Gammaproteobacteria bacterium 39-13]|nr:methylated-DNA--[protein]-cysteine S-methyltransferase [Gammaproteobacteria bacterium]OJV93057.1 MAG: hypothetical protein BGO43_07730 [Gammaproteobacteria bacterium 39-13]